MSEEAGDERLCVMMGEGRLMISERACDEKRERRVGFFMTLTVRSIFTETALSSMGGPSVRRHIILALF